MSGHFLTEYGSIADMMGMSVTTCFHHIFFGEKSHEAHGSFFILNFVFSRIYAMNMFKYYQMPWDFDFSGNQNDVFGGGYNDFGRQNTSAYQPISQGFGEQFVPNDTNAMQSLIPSWADTNFMGNLNADFGWDAPSQGFGQKSWGQVGEATPWSLAQINGATQWPVENSPSVPNYLANDWSDVDLWKPSGMGNSPEELASALKMYDNWMKIVQSYNDSLQKEKQFVSPLNLREELFGAPANSYQLAQNNLRNMKLDIGRLRQNALQNASKGIVADEGSERHVYLDTMCKKTIGNGKMIDKWNNFSQINFVKPDGALATEVDKLNCYNNFEQRIQELCSNKPIINGKIINYKAPYFEDECDLRITSQEMERLKNEHIEDDLKRLEKYVKNFYSYPPEMVNEIENRLYNVGWGNFRKLGVLELLNNSQYSLEEKKQQLLNILYQGKISSKRLHDSQERLQSK